jgi:hypothetical protein
MKPSLPIAVLLCSAAGSFGWELKPDPPAEKPWAVKADLSVPLPGKNDRVAFADGNGPFVLVGIGDGKTREVHDLRTGERTARFDCGESRTITESEYLSPDGKVWAFGKPFGKEVRLLATAAGKELGVAKVDGSIGSVGFADSGRLVVTGTKGRERFAWVYDTTGAEVAKLALAAGGITVPGMNRDFAVSPGGKYLAAVIGSKVAVHTLADGKKLTDLDLPAVPVPPGKFAPPVGMAFSAYGSELAAVVGLNEKKVGTLVVWSLTDGQKAEHAVERPEANPGLGSEALTPILSGGWLIDGSQVWAGGKVQRAVPNTRFLFNGRRAVTPEQVLGVAEVKPGGDRVVGVIGESTVTSGPAKDGTLAGAKEVPTDPAAGWPGPMPGFAPQFDPRPASVNLGGKRVVGLTGSLDGKRVLVEADTTPTPTLAKRRVVVLNVDGGVEITTFDLPPKRVLFGEAATADAVLTIGTEADGMERLELVGTDGKVIGGWRPHPDVKPNGFRSSILYAAAVSTTRAVTVGNGRVTLWQLPEAKAVWTTKFPEAAGGGLRADGKALFVPHAGGVRAIDLETGATLGNLTADPITLRPGFDPCVMAVSGDGGWVAVYGGSPLARTVRVWHLGDGKLTVTLSPGGLVTDPAVRFLSESYLLVGEGVYAVADGREVGRVKADANGVSARSAPADGHLWYSVQSGAEARVVPADFPTNELGTFLDEFAKHGQSVLKPGEKVKVVIEPPDGAPAGWEAKARTAARLGLGSAKLVEDDASTTVVTVRYTKLPGGAPVKLKWQGVENLGREETVRPFVVECKAEIARDERAVWSGPPTRSEMRIKEWPQVNEVTDDSKSGEEFFTRQVWAGAANSAGYPFFTLGSAAVTVNGQTWSLPVRSTLTADGVKTDWPTGFTPQPVPVSPAPPPAAPPPPATGPAISATMVWAGGGLCLGVLIAGGVVLLVLLRKKKPPPDDEDDRPRRARRVS